jgi:hypothetical protein
LQNIDIERLNITGWSEPVWQMLPYSYLGPFGGINDLALLSPTVLLFFI